MDTIGVDGSERATKRPVRIHSRSKVRKRYERELDDTNDSGHCLRTIKIATLIGKNDNTKSKNKEN